MKELPLDAEVTDLREASPKSLKDGKHHVHETEDGLHLWASVEEGRITWRVTDSEDREQEAVLIARSWEQGSCTICYEYEPAPGRCITKCITVPYPCYRLLT